MTLEISYISDHPISNSIHKDHQKGSIKLFTPLSFNEWSNTIDGIFSFVLYNEGLTEDEFNKSLLITGLSFYLNIIHNSEKSDRLSKWGAVIYTDQKTHASIHKLFPFYLYPKLAIAVAMWPYYSENDGTLEASIMRCMRYQAIELFPTKPICVRDADTIFWDALAYYRRHKKYECEIMNLIRIWETDFLNAWAGAYTQDENTADCRISEDVVLGTSSIYKEPWHLDIPFLIPFNEGAVRKFKLKELFDNKHNLMKYNSKGLYANFINISRNKTHISDLWAKCIEFLLTRYYMIISPNKDRLISDYFADDVNGWACGKDERLLLYVFVRHAFKSMHFFYIEYSINDPPYIKVKVDPHFPKQIQNHNIIRPGYINTVLNNKKGSIYIGDKLKQEYERMRVEYDNFLSISSPLHFYNRIYSTHSEKDIGDPFNLYFLKMARPISRRKVFTLKKVNIPIRNKTLRRCLPGHIKI